MPKEFEECIRKGGRVRTLKGKKYGLKKNQYLKVCFLNGKMYRGEVKTVKKKKK